MNNLAGNESQLITPPKSTNQKQTTQLAYLHAYDGVINKDYAYVVYREVKTRDGSWKIKIRSNQTAGTSIDPGHSIIRRKISEAAAAGKEYFVMGFNLAPREGDPRLVESRIYFDAALQPEYLELHLITRQPDGAPNERQVARVAWQEDGEPVQ